MSVRAILSAPPGTAGGCPSGQGSGPPARLVALREYSRGGDFQQESLAAEAAASPRKGRTVPSSRNLSTESAGCPRITPARHRKYRPILSEAISELHGRIGIDVVCADQLVPHHFASSASVANFGTMVRSALVCIVIVLSPLRTLYARARWHRRRHRPNQFVPHRENNDEHPHLVRLAEDGPPFLDRKSTRLNSSHLGISYAVFC